MIQYVISSIDGDQLSGPGEEQGNYAGHQEP